MKKFLSILIALAVMLMVIPLSVTAITDYNQTLILENKTDCVNTWVVIPDDGIQGTFEYNDSGTELEYCFSATGLTPVTSYDLISYKDPYPGTGSILIKTFLTDGVGNIAATTDTKAIGINLTSAKIWLVLASDFDEIMIAWQPLKYLFETDLINYQYTPSSSVGMETEVISTLAILGMSVDTVSLNFGPVAQGAVSVSKGITLTNTGDVPINVWSLVYGDFYKDCLELSSDGIVWQDAETWAYTPIATSTSKIIYARVNVPAGYTTGSYTGSVLFVASVAP